MADRTLDSADGTPGKDSASLAPPLDADPAGEDSSWRSLEESTPNLKNSPSENTPRSEGGGTAYDGSPPPKFKGTPQRCQVHPRVVSPGSFSVSIAILPHPHTMADILTLDELLDKLLRGDSTEKCNAALSLQFLSLNADKASLPPPRSLRLALSARRRALACENSPALCRDPGRD